ncbi:MAG: transcriptional regulator [Alphaproteobacteria bacterium]|nr:transcriptional regulator [Alphaproteobacteria bacterium]
MTRTQIGLDVEAALGEALAHARGEVALPSRIIDAPTAEHVRAIREATGLSRAKFETIYGIDARALQDWEQGRRTPDRTARVLLAVIQKEPDAVKRTVSG